MVAENFILKDQFGKDFELYRNLDKHVLLVFYPKDNSPVCSKQLRNYSDNRENFNNSKIRIVAINNESIENHLGFCENSDLDIIFLSDPDYKVIKNFSAVYPFNIVKRKLVLIGMNGEILFEKNLPPYSYWNYDRIIGILRQKQIV